MKKPSKSKPYLEKILSVAKERALERKLEKEKERLEKKVLLDKFVNDNKFPFKFGDIICRVFSKSQGQSLIVVGQPILSVRTRSVWRGRGLGGYIITQIPGYTAPVVGLVKKAKHPGCADKKTRKKKIFLDAKTLPLFKKINDIQLTEKSKEANEEKI